MPGDILMNLPLTFSHYRAWIAFLQIFICGIIGTIIAWASGLHWSIGAEYGLALGCGIYAASQTDNSEKISRRDHI
jgi:hypothetical protein